MEHHVLYRTEHGSRLYGLSHADSDFDYYTVVDKVKTAKARYSTHKIIDKVDSVVVDFGTFIDNCRKGVPQALEAMFASDEHVLIDTIGPFRAGFRVGSDEVWDRYLRTIKSFAMQDDFKHKRHALRLAFNLRGLRAHGRFNPTLTPLQVELVNELATLPAQYVYDDALVLAWS